VIIENLSPTFIWFLIGLLLLVIEISSFGIVLLFFGLSAWVTALASWLFDISLNTQLLIFITVSLLSLVSLRRFLKRVFIGQRSDSQELQTHDEFIGKKARVIQAITPDTAGKVEFHGSYWTAESSESLAENQTVEITHIQSTVLTVKSHSH